MSTHIEGTFHPAPAHHAAEPKKRFWTKKKLVAAAVAGAVAIPGAAYAAVFLFGFGDFSANAATAGTLTIVGEPTLTKTLAPGQTVGVKGMVKNENDYPVKVTSIIVKNISVAATPAAGSPANSDCKVTFATPNQTVEFPKDGNDAAIANGGTQFALDGNGTTIQPNQTVWVTASNVIKQDESATVLCGVSARYAVKGAVGAS